MADLISSIRGAVNGVWAAALANAPQYANPNLRTGVTLNFRFISADTTLLAAGDSVVLTLNSATSNSGTVQETGVLQQLNLTTDSSGDVTGSFVVTLDVSQYYQVDATVTDSAGNSDTISQVALLNPQPGSDWGWVANYLIFVDTTIPGTAQSSAATSAAISVTVGVYDSNGNPVTSASVAYAIAPQNPDGTFGSAVTIASGTTDDTGSFVAKNVAVELTPTTAYQRTVTVSGMSYIVGDVYGITNSTELGSAIVANGYLSATVTTGAGGGASS